MNFGVVFAVILSLPLARLEVSPIEGRPGGGGRQEGEVGSVHRGAKWGGGSGRAAKERRGQCLLAWELWGLGPAQRWHQSHPNTAPIHDLISDCPSNIAKLWGPLNCLMASFLLLAVANLSPNTS